MTQCLRRRTLVAGLASSGLAGIAGCFGDSESEDGDDDTSGDNAEENDTGTATAWGMYGNDARNTFATDDPGPGTDPEIAWSKPIVDRLSQRIAPVVNDETVYVPTSRSESDADLLAIDVTDGERRWGWDLNVPSWDGAHLAVVEGDRYGATTEVLQLDPDEEVVAWQAGRDDDILETEFLVIGEEIAVYHSQSTLIAVDIEDEAVRWTRSFDNRPEPPAIDGDHVYVGSRSGGYLEALSLADGETRWELDSSHDRSGPAVDGDTVYFGEGFSAVAVDAAAGDEQWRERMGGTVARPPAIGDDAVYFPGTGRVASYTRSDGTERWSRDVESGLSTGVLTPDRFYTGTRDGTLIAFDRSDGTIVWELDVGERIIDAPAVAEDTLYVVSDGDLYAVR